MEVAPVAFGPRAYADDHGVGEDEKESRVAFASLHLSQVPGILVRFGYSASTHPTVKEINRSRKESNFNDTKNEP